MKVLNPQMIEDTITLKIWSDIGGILNIEEIRVDPVGNSVYLYFLLKNKKRGYEVESLINWMNEWVNEIILKENVSRAMDVEIASAVLGYHSLKKYGKLKENVRPEKINEFLSSYFDNGHFFENFSLSTLIGIGVFDIKENMEFFTDLIEWIKIKITEQNVLHDGKNVLFSYLLFQNFEEEMTKSLFGYSYQKFEKGAILFSEELYNSYILWENRRFSKDKLILKRIRQSVSESIKNADGHVRRTDKSEISKIYKGVLLDIVNEFEKTTIKVSKEEVTLDDLDRMILLAPTFSILLLLLGTHIGNLIRIGYLDSFLINQLGVWTSDRIINTGIHAFIYILILSFYLTGGSILYDIIYKKIARTEVITKNVVNRFNDKILPLILGPTVIISVLEWFFS